MPLSKPVRFIERNSAQKRSMADFSDEEDRALVQLALQHAEKGKKRISWKAIATMMRATKRPEQLRLRLAGLKKRFGSDLVKFPRWYHIKKGCSKPSLAISSRKDDRKHDEPATLGRGIITATASQQGDTALIDLSTTLIDLFGEDPSSDEENLVPLVNTDRRKTPRSQHQQQLQYNSGLTDAYKIFRKYTDKLGGSVAEGAIYGEITQGSFQKIVDFLKRTCEFSSESSFLDIGSGFGKPNFHVAIDPGVEISYGVELEEIRCLLSLCNLKSALQTTNESVISSKKLFFSVGDIMNVNTFNPFSHIYTYDDGFPPMVLIHIAQGFNRSLSARYLISYHSPNEWIDNYGLEAEVIGQLQAARAGKGSKTCYFYKRLSSSWKRILKQEKKLFAQTEEHSQAEKEKEKLFLPIDPLFQHGFDVVARGKDGVLASIETFFKENLHGKRSKRIRKQTTSATRRR